MAASSGPKAQYQHFVSQFLLRNFSHPYVDADPATSHLGKKARRRNGQLVPGDAVVSSAALSENPIRLVETPVKRILGQMDMYNDASHPQAPNHIEKMFGDMESRVSTIFRKITKAFATGDAGLWLTRTERNDVRKFLFLLKYRGSVFHRRFNHNTAEEYNSDDRDLFLEYMAKRGFTRPIEVWFDNLKAIMELKMDAGGEWMQQIRRQIYHEDAEWFVMHAQSFYMAICTPEDPSDEFIITDGCYNVFEGRSEFARDTESGEVGPVQYINFHEFTPISPKLMIVLRSFLFPCAEEHADPELKRSLELARASAVNNVYGPGTLEKSLLFHLPIEKAQNSYTTMANGIPRLVHGEDGSHRAGHKFLFRFFPINQEYVHKINGIFLDNAYHCTHAVYSSKESFLKSLEWYMTAKPEVIGKSVMVADGEQRRRLLEKLDTLLKSLGSKEKSVWDETPIERGYYRDFHTKWHLHIHREIQRLRDDPSQSMNPLLQIYTILGGSATMFWDDFDHSRRMWTFRVKIDSWSQGVDEDIRQRNRDLVTAAYLRCPPFRFWLYMKLSKFIRTGDSDKLSQKKIRQPKAEDAEFKDAKDTEDIIATGRILVDSDLDINRLIYTTVSNEIEMRKRPGLDIWRKLNFTLADLPRLMLIHMVAFKIPGPICDCGIPEIEVFARLEEHRLRSMESIEIQGFDSTPFGEDEVIEIVTRIKVREIFIEVLEDKMKLEFLQKLKRVFFELTYPTPPTT